jgi:amino acid transporter
VIWGAVFLLLCTFLNLVRVNVFKLVIALGVYTEIVGSFGVTLLLFFFFRQHEFSELFEHLGTGTAPSQTAAFLGGPSSDSMPAPPSRKKRTTPSAWSHAQSFCHSPWWEEWCPSTPPP